MDLQDGSVRVLDDFVIPLVDPVDFNDIISISQDDLEDIQNDCRHPRWDYTVRASWKT